MTAPQPLDYSIPVDEPNLQRFASFILLTVGLLVGSASVVLIGAAQAPYFSPMVWTEAATQVGLGSMLILTWLAWAFVLVSRTMARQLRPAWLVLLLMPAIASFYLANGVIGYIEEVQHNRAIVASPPPTTRPGTSAAPSTVP